MEFKKYNAGKSDARIRQGGDIVPVPPRSGEIRKSCDGPAARLTASLDADNTIARRLNKEKIIPTPLYLKGGGDSDEEEVPFMGLRDPKKEEISKIDEIAGRFLKADKFGDTLFGAVEEFYMKMKDSCRSEEEDERAGVLLAFSLLRAGNIFGARYDKAIEGYNQMVIDREELLQKYKDLKKRNDDIGKKLDELELKKKDKWSHAEDRCTQTEDTDMNIEKTEIITKNVGIQAMDIPQRKKRGTDKEIQTENLIMEIEQGSDKEIVPSRGLERKVDEILGRILKLEEKYEKTKEKSKKAEEEPPWTKVLGRKKKFVEEEKRREDSSKVVTKTKETGIEKRQRSRSRSGKLQKIPKGVGVIIDIKNGRNQDYEEVIRECAQNIPLEELGIPPVKMRRTRNGGILLEVQVQGKDEEEMAKLLVDRIEEVTKKKKEEIRVWSTKKMIRLRLTGLPPGATAEEIATMVAKEGGEAGGRIRVGPLRTSASGAGSAWVDCPVELALRVAGAPGLTLGWARVGVSLVEGGSPQCFRCLGRGHLGRWCPSVIDRGRCCLRCGEEGHMIGRCRSDPRCPVCALRGLPADHRPGDPSRCRPVPPGALRQDAPRGASAPSPPDPGGGTGGEKERRGAASSVGQPSDEAVPDPSPRESVEETRGGSRGKSPGAAREGPSAGPSGRFWGMDLSGSDMEVEPEGSLKRKCQETECKVVLAPLPQREKLGKGKKKKK